jgi:hypothetical protein
VSKVILPGGFTVSFYWNLRNACLSLNEGRTLVLNLARADTTEVAETVHHETASGNPGGAQAYTATWLPTPVERVR